MPQQPYARRPGAAAPYARDTLGARLEQVARRFPEREALVDVACGRRWTYERFARDVDLLALGLLGKGVARGERIALWAPGTADWALVLFAVARVGAVLVSVGPVGVGPAGVGPADGAEAGTEHEAEALRDVLQRSDAGILFAVHEREERAEEAWNVCPSLREVFLLPSGAAEDDPSGWSEPMDLGLQMTVSVPGGAAERQAELSCDDPVLLRYAPGAAGVAGAPGASGTSEGPVALISAGVPGAPADLPDSVTFSHRDLLDAASAAAASLGRTERDRVCLPVPFHHPAGLVPGLLATVSTGACAVLPGPEFVPAAVLRAVAAERCTALHGEPGMFRAELAVLGEGDGHSPPRPPYDLGPLRTAVVSGEPRSGEPPTEEFLRRVTTGMGLDRAVDAARLPVPSSSPVPSTPPVPPPVPPVPSQQHDQRKHRAQEDA